MSHRIPIYLVLASALLLSAGPVRGQGSETTFAGTIQGRILGDGWTHPVPLPNAIVSISSGGVHLTVTADSRGRYAFSPVAGGTWKVRAVHVGYRSTSATVRVPPSGTVTLDLSLGRRPVSLPGLLVRGDPLTPLQLPEGPPASELGEVALRALEGTSGMVEGGLAQVVRALPGNDESDPQDVLLMRGSATDLKLVLLDGAPIYTPFHMAGLLESFDPRALGGASLFLGGAPSRFDGGLSYILDLHGRRPHGDRFRGSAAVDLLTARAFLEGPLTSSTGVLVSARTLHEVGTPLLAQGSSPYGFGDVLARLEWRGDDGWGAWLSAFGNGESVRLSLPDETREALDEAPGTGEMDFLDDPPSALDQAGWGNRALSAGLEASVGDTRVRLGAAHSRYEAELPVGDTLPLFAESRSRRTRLTLDLSKPWGPGALRFGANLDRLDSEYTAVSLDSASVGEVNRAGLGGSSGGVYVEGTRPLTSSLSVRGGARIDAFTESPGLRFAPRLSFTWMLTEQAALTFAAGRYHQYSNVAQEQLHQNIGAGEPGSPGTGLDPLVLTLGTADHLVVSLDQILTPELRLGLEGFVKEFSGVSGIEGRKLNASGVDLRVAREGERTAGWLGYTLTWFWASDGILTSGSSPFSGRHLLSAGLTTSLTERVGLRLRGSYGDGLPFTSVPVLSSPVMDSPVTETRKNLRLSGDQVLNSAPELTVGPDEGFLRLEVEVYGRWTPTVSGRSMELRPYVRVLNALNRRDALFYHFDPWRNEGPEPLADLPVLPLFGLEWRF